MHAYDYTNFKLVNNTSFRSIRKASKELLITASTLNKILDSGKSFKGYFYYSEPKNLEP